MSTISKILSGFMYNGSALALGTAPFKSNLNAISGFNAAGTGYTSYRPSNAFNSLTQLTQDGVYIVDAKTTGFDIPGAVLTATIPTTTPPTSSELSLDSVRIFNQRVVGGQTAFDLDFELSSTNPDDSQALVSFYEATYGFNYGFDPAPINYGSPTKLTNIYQNTGSTFKMLVVSNTGNIVTKTFTI